MIHPIVMAIQKARNELDIFNLEVANFRVQNGMSKELIYLYYLMGRLDKSMCKDIKRVEEILQLFFGGTDDS